MDSPKDGHTLTEVIRLYDFVLKSPDVRLSANGVYTFGNPKPLQVDLTVMNAPPTETPTAIASNTESKVINGTIKGHARLVGTVDPLQLEVRGDLDGREIDLRGHHFGQIKLLMSDQSHIDSNGVFIYTESLDFLGGKWGLDGIYVFDTRGLKVDVALQDVSLKDIATLADQQNVNGSLSGHLIVFVPGLHFDPNTLEIPPSEFTLKNIEAADMKLVEQIDATLSLAGGNLELKPIRLKQGAGRGDVRVGMNFSNPRQINLGATFSAWPFDMPGELTHIDGWLGLPDLVIELPDPKAPDPAKQRLRLTAHEINVHSTTSLKGEVLGNMEAFAGLEGREIDLRSAHMRLLGGRFDGQAHANLDNLITSTAEFTWENLDLQKLALIFPQLKEVHGILTGNARLAPTTVPRPREPLALVITTQFADGHWRTIPVQDIRVAAYLGPNEDVPGAGWRHGLGRPR